MRRLVFLVLMAPAFAGPTPEQVFKAAVKAQGALTGPAIKDITLTFKGQIVDAGGQRVNTVVRTYRYRPADGSFYVRTASKAAKAGTERGVLGRTGYWERASNGTILALQRGNKEDRAAVQTIRKNRNEFQRILRMVLLARLDDGKSKLSLARVSPIHLEHDLPYEARGTLGRDRKKHAYHVLDVEREGQPRLRLFVRTNDYTVRKVVQFDKEHPQRRRWFFYFGYYKKNALNALNLPQYFSAYDQMPVDEASKKARNKIRGEPKLLINTGLKDADFRPEK